jgi:hypothetical protein
VTARVALHAATGNSSGLVDVEAGLTSAGLGGEVVLRDEYKGRGEYNEEEGRRAGLTQGHPQRVDSRGPAGGGDGVSTSCDEKRRVSLSKRWKGRGKRTASTAVDDTRVGVASGGSGREALK